MLCVATSRACCWARRPRNEVCSPRKLEMDIDQASRSSVRNGARGALRGAPLAGGAGARRRTTGGVPRRGGESMTEQPNLHDVGARLTRRRFLGTASTAAAVVLVPGLASCGGDD